MKRILSVSLVTCLMVLLLPTTAFAKTTTYVYEGISFEIPSGYLDVGDDTFLSGKQDASIGFAKQEFEAEMLENIVTDLDSEDSEDFFDGLRESLEEDGELKNEKIKTTKVAGYDAVCYYVIQGEMICKVYMLGDYENEQMITIGLFTFDDSYIKNYDKMIKEAKKSDGKETTTSKDDKTEISTEGVSPELVAFLDEYQEFIDEYIEFYEKYQENPSDPKILKEFVEINEKFEEYNEKLNEISESDLSPEDEVYYMEIMLEVSAKLLAVL